VIRLLTGENEFALQQAQKNATNTFLSKFDAFGLERLDADELDVAQLRDAVLQLPFLVDKKLVVIKNVFSSKVIQEALLGVLLQIPDVIDVIIVDAKADKRTRLYKELLSQKKVELFEQLKGNALISWGKDYAKSYGGAISVSDMEYLIDRIGSSQMLLARELEKLSVFGSIDKELIETHTEQALKGSIFDLLDLVFRSKTDAALTLYDQLIANKTDPSEILSLIGWQLHIFALIKYAGDGSSGDIAKMIGVHPFVVGKAQGIVRTMSTGDIKNAVASALEADVAIKTTSADSHDVVRVLLLSLSEQELL
jgi:DNA polymerase-3 subunit delta